MRQNYKYIGIFFAWIKQKRYALFISLFNVLLLSIFAYILNNQTVFTGEDLNQFAWMELLKNKFGIGKTVGKDDVLFVNISYDKQLIDVFDEFSIPIGNTDITDRSKLLSLLQRLHSTNQYTYIFLDVRFEKGFDVPEVDSLLYSEILNMRNLVVVSHVDVEIADSSLLSKSAYNDFDATIVSTNFVRYSYSYREMISMPLYAYRDLKGMSINKHGIFYSCNGELCYNSLFLNFPIEKFNEFDDNNQKIYYNLGSDLLDNYSEEDLGMLTNGKYVVICDMVEDLHDTYSGKKPGSVIAFYAFKALMDNKHVVNYWVLLLFAFVYFIISMLQFSHRSLIEMIPFVRDSHSDLLHFAFSFVEFTVILSFVVVVLNLIWNVSTSILLPSIYFSIQKNIINYKRIIV